MLTIRLRANVVISSSCVNLRTWVCDVCAEVHYAGDPLPSHIVYKIVLLAAGINLHCPGANSRNTRKKKRGRDSFALTFTFRYHNGHHCFFPSFHFSPPASPCISTLALQGVSFFSRYMSAVRWEKPRRPQRATYPPFVITRTLAFVGDNERTIHKLTRAHTREKIGAFRFSFRCTNYTLALSLRRTCPRYPIAHLQKESRWAGICLLSVAINCARELSAR